MQTVRTEISRAISAIEGSTEKYRHSNDTSESLFHPKMGFVEAYDISKVNQALNTLLTSLSPEYEEVMHTLTTSQKLLKEAREIVEAHPDIDIRDFARAVAAFLVMDVSISDRIRPNPLASLKLVPSIKEEGDVLN